MTATTDDFLKRNNLTAAAIDTASVLADFQSEMENGLTGATSSLKMIPTFITPASDLPRNKSVIVIDAGGTNLRTALVSFDSKGIPSIDKISRHSMPGTGAELSAAEFYATLQQYLDPMINESDRIGFCFSYPAEITPERDGRLIHWTKDIRVPELEGQLVGQGLLQALGDTGNSKKLTLLNDTIATLLAGKAHSAGKTFSTYIGLILGTGTNMAYIEQNANITKLNQPDTAGEQAINVESGGFALAPACEFDKLLDASTINPGEYLFEKMIAGLYRGRLVLLALKAAAKDGLFSEKHAAHITEMQNLEGIQVDQFMRNKPESPLISTTLTDADQTVARDIISAIYNRIAKLTALNIAAAVIKADPPANGSVCINIDGSTYYKSFGFQDMTEKHLASILGSRGINYELMHVDEAPIIGAAIGGLI